MDHAVSAAEANRSFSLLLRQVREGQSFVVTSHGRPVARIVPCAEPDLAREQARDALLQRLGEQRVADVGSWHREDLYGR